jgi:type II secretory pathway pseudopilin PulG
MFRTSICSWRLAVGSWQGKKPSPARPLPTANRKLPTGQEGFTLAALLVLLTIIAIVIAYTVPEQWSMIMARERDRQTIFLMKQYARAIKAWSMKNGGMPTSLDQITEAKEPRVIRGGGKWLCPITGKEDDWILVPFNAIQNPPQPNQLQAQPSKLIKEASPREYVGPFVGVRPGATGKSFLEFNGAKDYSEWVYTVMDLEVDIAAENAADTAK